MSTERETASPPTSTRNASAHPTRLVVLALVVLGAFEIGRLISGVVIGPWLSQVLLGARTPVMVGHADVSRVVIEVVAIGIGVCLAGIIAVPVARVVLKR